MRTLRFIVDGMQITPDPKCNFDGLVPGSSEYVQAEFVFSPEWKGVKKVVAFYSRLGRQYPAQGIEGDNTCKIPTEALARERFKLCVVGMKNKAMYRTNKVEVIQNGG